MKHLSRIFGTFIRDEEGSAGVEVILILVVLVGLVVIFKSQITSLANNIWKSITQKSNSVIK